MALGCHEELNNKWKMTGIITNCLKKYIALKIGWNNYQNYSSLLMSDGKRKGLNALMETDPVNIPMYKYYTGKPNLITYRKTFN